MVPYRGGENQPGLGVSSNLSLESTKCCKLLQEVQALYDMYLIPFGAYITNDMIRNH